MNKPESSQVVTKITSVYIVQKPVTINTPNIKPGLAFSHDGNGLSSTTKPKNSDGK